MMIIAALVVVCVFQGWAVTDEDLKIRLRSDLAVHQGSDDVVRGIHEYRRYSYIVYIDGSLEIIEIPSIV